MGRMPGIWANETRSGRAAVFRVVSMGGSLL
jgi:hypothetical protein